MNPAHDILQKESLSKNDLRVIIYRTFNLFGSENDECLCDAYIAMTYKNPLLWTLQHFLREVQLRNWNLNIVFNDTPHLLHNDLEKTYAPYE